jgi:hypothetical protein
MLRLVAQKRGKTVCITGGGNTCAEVMLTNVAVSKRVKENLLRLYNDFGDVFAYETADFWTWWTEKVNEYETRGEYLFAEQIARKMEVSDDADFEDVEDTLIVKIPLEVRTQHLVRNFRRMLNDYEQRVKQARNKSRARYKVWAKVSNNTLYKTLKVYDYVQQH